jgi:hypothetical protein
VTTKTLFKVMACSAEVCVEQHCCSARDTPTNNAIATTKLSLTVCFVSVFLQVCLACTCTRSNALVHAQLENVLNFFVSVFLQVFLACTRAC